MTACADISGLSDYSSCSGDCREGGGATVDGPGSSGFADSQSGDDVSMTGQVDVTEPFDSGADSTYADTFGGGMDSTLPDVAGDVVPVADTGMDTTMVHDVGGPDIGPDVPIVMEAATVTGRECWGPDGGAYLCQAGQLCCVNAVTYGSECVTGSSCPSPYTPVNCAGATGNYPDASLCGPSQACCGMLTLNGGNLPNCNATQLSSACQSSCADVPPASCLGTFTIRLCGKAADCAGDGLNNSCCRFGQSPVYWCATTFGSAACLQ
ncbi:MAG TPA: hypothetical protein VKU41_14485 [Polyangiaceae bacterium]|nr:hypothetical protein [Polyangiaceae bacterium]